MHIVLFLLFGLIFGITARFVVAGREPGGWLVSIGLGILGSALGAFLGRLFGVYGEGESAGFFVSASGAVVVILGYHTLLPSPSAGAKNHIFRQASSPSRRARPQRK